MSRRLPRWRDLLDAGRAAITGRLPLDVLVRHALEADGLQAAVSLLNERVPHRYTAVHRLVVDQMTSLAIHDQWGQDVAALQTPVDLGHSFCQYTVRDGIFVTQAAASDVRLNGHVAQGRIATYHGVALVDANGKAFGSLCHFDTELCFFRREAFEQMKPVAAEIARFLSAQPPAATDWG